VIFSGGEDSKSSNRIGVEARQPEIARTSVKHFQIFFQSIAEEAEPPGEIKGRVKVCTNISPPHRGGANPCSSSKWSTEIVRQLSRGVRPSGHSQSSVTGHGLG